MATAENLNATIGSELIAVTARLDIPRKKQSSQEPATPIVRYSATQLRLVRGGLHSVTDGRPHSQEYEVVASTNPDTEVGKRIELEPQFDGFLSTDPTDRVNRTLQEAGIQVAHRITPDGRRSIRLVPNGVAHLLEGNGRRVNREIQPIGPFTSRRG